MKTNRTALALTLGAAAVLAVPKIGHAQTTVITPGATPAPGQSTTVITPAPTTPPPATPAPGESVTVVNPAPTTEPVGAEQHKAIPNRPLLATGVVTLAVGYGAAVAVGVFSDHKGDNKLFIPVVGPWLDLGQRGCSGATIPTSNGPYELSSQSNCGTSGIETAALIVDGAVQGLGALATVGSFFIPETRFRGLAQTTPSSSGPRFAVAPTSFGGRGAGAVAVGHF